MSTASDSGERKSISDKTSVQLGLIVVVIGFVLSAMGFVVGAIWWAATMNTKVDSLISITSMYRIEAEGTRKTMSDLDTRVRLLEQHKP
jgi:hypothetical protein